MTHFEYQNTLSALALWRESRSHPFCMPALYHVILNRLRDRRWPDDIVGVILQPKQFSSFNADDPNAVKWPKTGLASWQCAMNAVTDPGDDPTGGANHYHSYPAGHKSWPRWATAETLTVEIGPFHFYKR